jgi:Uma2 family endonuclease
MRTTVLRPEEIYLSSSFEPDAEFVDGVIIERPTGEFDHNAWQVALSSWFLSHGREWNIYVATEQRTRVKARNYRVPDVAVMDRATGREQVVTAAPLAVFEILSPTDTVQELYRELREYAAMGVARIWVVDPKTDQLHRYVNGSLEPSTRFEFAERGIVFDFKDLAHLLQK